MLPLLVTLLLSQAADPADLARGKKIFESMCTGCHGQTGEGGRGPSLAQPRLPRAADDAALIEVLRLGIQGTEMPGAWMLSQRELTQLAGYVRSLGRIAVVPLPGHVERGRALYSKLGCAACHIVRGQGSGLGPELTEVGARRNAAYLRESIVNPAAAVPEGFVMFLVVSREGSRVEGQRVAEDSFTIQLRDAAGRFHSFRKRDLTEIKNDSHKSPMPSFQSRLSAVELDDLVAYLANLRGEK